MVSEFRIVSPCAADWNAMTPTAVGRHCTACGKDVVDLTCLSPRERTLALERIERDVVSGRQVCVRAFATSDGWCSYRRLWTNWVAAMLAMTFSGCQGEGPPVTSAPTQTTTQPPKLPLASVSEHATPQEKPEQELEDVPADAS